MTIQIAGKNFELTEAIKEHVNKTLRARFDAYEGLVVKADVVLEAVHNPHGENPAARVQVKIEIPGPDLIVEKTGEDLYDLVTVVVGTAFEQLEKRKEKGEI